MDLMLLAAESEWGALTAEAGELAREWELGAFIHPFPIQVGVVSKKVDRVYQFEAGLIRQYSDKPADVFRWDEIVTWRESVHHHYNRSAVVESNYLQSTFHYELTRDDGVTVHLEGIFRKDGSRRQGSAYNALGRSVCDYLGQLRLPDAMDRVQRGEAVDFGDYSVSDRGVRAKRTEIPWPALERVEVENGRFYLHEVGRGRIRFTRAVGVIPRFSLLTRLIQAMLSE